MDIRGTVRNWVRRPVSYVGGEWNRMAPRERRLVAGLLAAIAAFTALVTGFLVIGSLRDIADTNDSVREALALIAKNRTEYLDAKARMVEQEVRIGSESPQLAADLESAAREVGIQIPETNEHPPAPAGRRYLEHKVVVKLRQVDLLSLSKFLAKVETGRRLIVVSKMNVRRRASDGEAKLDVELTAIAYERVKEDRRPKKAPGKGTRT